MPSGSVKHFHHSMQGAPQLSNNFGALTSMLDAVLVTGFNLRPVSTLTRTNATVTLTVVADHLYEVGQVIGVAGADQAAYNGEFSVLSVTANTLTYAVSGAPVSPATGSAITVRTAPLGWEIALTGTQKRAYRSLVPESRRPFLRVDDSQDPLYPATFAKKGKVTMAEGMSDIDTFVGARAPFDPNAPTRNEVATGSGEYVVDGWHKWYYAKTGGNPRDFETPGTYNRQWSLVGDTRGFFLFNQGTDGSGMGGKCFTDFESFRAGDAFNTLLSAQDAYMSASAYGSQVDSDAYNSSDFGTRFARTGDSTGKIAMRGFLQVGVTVGLSFVSLGTSGQVVTGLSTGIAYPNGPDNSLILHPVYLKEGAHLRGKLPGMYFVHNDSPQIQHREIVTGVVGFPGRSFIMLRISHGFQGNNASAMVAFDITGPWW